MSAWAEFAGARQFGDAVTHLYETYVPPLETVPALDAALGGGLRPGLNVLAGVSSAGKSAVACCAATSAAFGGRRVLYMTLDDSAETIFDRCCAAWTAMADMAPKSWAGIQREVFDEIQKRLGPSAATADRGLVSRAAYDCAQVDGSTCNLVARFADEVGPYLAIETDCANALEAAGWVETLARQGERPDLVVVDYAQQYRSGQADFDRDTKERVRAVCAALKEVSERNQVCVLLVSAITRESAKGADEPSLNWLKDSAEIGYLCQTCSILTVPKEGEVGADDPDGRGPAWRQVELTVVKNKAGQSGQVAQCALWGRYCTLNDLGEAMRREGRAYEA